MERASGGFISGLGGVNRPGSNTTEMLYWFEILKQWNCVTLHCTHH